jgi:hypothetical protein
MTGANIVFTARRMTVAGIVFTERGMTSSGIVTLSAAKGLSFCASKTLLILLSYGSIVQTYRWEKSFKVLILALTASASLDVEGPVARNF